MVTGAPSARLTRLLDACADRESRGAGAVWRLTAGSIRRALDAGTNADELASALEAASRTGLPATTRVLIDDVARRHGSLRLRPATSVLHSADAPLLAQAVADRSLARLGLSLLAPTVATCTAPVAEALAALRKAGYLPMPEDAAGVVQVAEGPGRLPARQATPAGPGDGEGAARGAAVEDPLATLAGALVAAGRGSTKATGTEADLLAAGSRLSRTENRMLAQAVDDGAAVTIEYVSTTGSMSSRMVSDLQLEGTTLWGWCELRNGEQDFTVSRIVGVAPAL